MANELDSVESSIHSSKIEFSELKVGNSWDSSKIYELSYILWSMTLQAVV